MPQAIERLLAIPVTKAFFPVKSSTIFFQFLAATIYPTTAWATNKFIRDG